MTITVTTIFPALFQGLLSEGIVARAIEKGLVKIGILNLRDFTTDSYKTVDDYPYGGGPGMVMKAEPVLRAVASVTGIDYLWGPAAGAECDIEGAIEGNIEGQVPSRGVSEKVSARSGRTTRATSQTRIIILSPQGRKYDQNLANELSACESVILVCGRYKATDERVGEILGAEEISIGDYVLSGGELPAMVVIESLVRLIPGAMEDEDSAAGDSFEEGILDCAYYTRPEAVAGKKVPEVLLSGNHEAIRKWRRKNRLLRTLERRSDLLETSILSKEDRKLLSECRKEHGSTKEPE
jgi:tRNA (guanine37-N1)-methyltransferase